MLSDFRLAARTLSKNPGFSLTAVGALALGIGANAAIFSVVNQVLLNPAGVSHPERVVALRAKYDKLNLRSIGVSIPDFASARDSRAVFEHAAVVNSGDYNYTGAEGAVTAPERLQGAAVSVEWFDVFGARPMVGRVFRPEEDRPNANQEVVLAYAAWKRLFGGDPRIEGKTLTLNDRIYRVVGVMGPEFRWPREAELWTPLGLPADAYSPNNTFNENYSGFARLRAGVPFERGNAWMQVLSDRVRQGVGRGSTYARDSGWGLFAVPLTDYVAGDTKKPLLILLGAVAFVLLIACANIAGLMLARTTGRAREIAVRAALGAGRWALMRQTLAESFLLAATGAVAGLLLGYAGVRGLLVLAPEGATAGLTAQLNGQVLWFTAAASAFSAVLFGLAPAWQIARIEPNSILKGSGRSGMSGRGRQRLRSTLVICETALALLLLVGAGLFLRSLARLEVVNPGFEPRGVITGILTLPQSRYAKEEQQIPFFRAVTERLAATPGVEAAAMGLPLPFSGSEASASFSILEKPTGANDPGPHGDVRLVTPGYFKALGIPLKQGRWFTDQDRADTQWVAVVDENLARQYWPGMSPVGQHIRGGAPSRGQWATVIGVVGHVHHSSLASDTGKGVYYYSMWQRSAPFTMVAVRTGADPARFASAIRAAVSAVDPSEPVHDLKTMQDLVENSLAPRRFVVRLLSFFAAAALLLAALGLYGVIGYSVAQRTQEIGIRVALGAGGGSVLKMVIGQGVRLALAGTAFGFAASLALGGWLRTQLFGIDAFDPLTLLVTAAVLIGAAVLASYIPARRAMRVSPVEALRWE
ncbi:MAG TPA: ABC transporter permease [Bryobacteraceae bacterium]|nr:ABC transporter permease [Bryobacteraceae bacterium]